MPFTMYYGLGGWVTVCAYVVLLGTAPSITASGLGVLALLSLPLVWALWPLLWLGALVAWWCPTCLLP